MARHLEAARSVAVVVQIEDPEGVEAIEEIAAVPGIASCSVGRADLAVAFGATALDDPVVDAAVERVLAACRASGIPLSTFVPDMAAAGPWFAKGVRMIAVASEHKPMRSFFSRLVNTARGGIVDEGVLLAALDAGVPAIYATDVLASEPSAADDPLLARDDVILAPHSAATTAEGMRRMAYGAAQNALDFIDRRLEPAMTVLEPGAQETVRS